MKKLLKQPKLSLFLYVMTAFVAVYAIYSFYAVCVYIQTTYIEYYGYTWAEYGSDFILMILQSIETYIFYAIILFTLGKIVCLLDPMYGFPEDFLEEFEDEFEEEFEDEEVEEVEEVEETTTEE